MRTYAIIALSTPSNFLPMAPTSPRNSVEQRGLLRSTSFEIDDADSVDRFNKQSNRAEDGRFGPRRRWKTSSAWLRPRNLLICLAVALGLIVVGAFWFYQPGRKLIEKLEPSAPAESVTSKSILAEPTPIKIVPSETLDLDSQEKPNPTSTEPPSSTSVETSNPTYTETPNPKSQDPKAHKFEKPKDFKIIGLVFFGRPPVVAILDCYLKKNLVSNGGFLDEVLWAVNTHEAEDLKYLEELIKTSENYKKVDLPQDGYKAIWANAVEDGPMYIKIDDDMASP